MNHGNQSLQPWVREYNHIRYPICISTRGYCNVLEFLTLVETHCILTVLEMRWEAGLLNIIWYVSYDVELMIICRVLVICLTPSQCWMTTVHRAVLTCGSFPALAQWTRSIAGGGCGAPPCNVLLAMFRTEALDTILSGVVQCVKCKIK